MLAYLQVVDNPGYVTAFRRAINVPKRGMGDKSIDGIVKAAEIKKISPFEVLSRAVRGSSLGDIKPAQKKALKPFVKLIEHVRAMAVEGGSVADMIAHIVTAVEYKDHLMRVHGPDADERMDNIEELKRVGFATTSLIAQGLRQARRCRAEGRGGAVRARRARRGVSTCRAATARLDRHRRQRRRRHLDQLVQCRRRDRGRGHARSAVRSALSDGR